MIPEPDICDHCGLPAVFPRRVGGRCYCCIGCSIVSRLAGDKDRHSLRAWNLMRLGVGAFLAMDVMMISLGLYTDTFEPASLPMFHRVMLILSAAAIAILVWPLAQGAWQEIRRGRLSLDTLIAVGSLAAFGVSAANVIRGAGHVYFDTATMLPLLVTFGRMIEAAAKTQARDLVRGLATLLPEKAMRVSPSPGEVAPGQLAVGDRIRVRPGERFAADGVIVEGSTVVAEAAFTGESAPRARGVGQSVIAGCVNGPGSVVIEARSVGAEMLLGRIVRMVRQAQAQASPAVRSAQAAASVFAPAVLILAAATGVVWAAMGRPGHGAVAALAVLVVACPCAMGIAAPLATAIAIAAAARAGLLVRGGDVMERVAHVSIVFLDKTGTLTWGRPAVKAVQPAASDVDTRRLLAAMAGLESASEHPLAAAVIDEATARDIAVPRVKGVRVFPGRGLSGSVLLDGTWRAVLAGSEEFVSAGAADAAAGRNWDRRDGDSMLLARAGGAALGASGDDSAICPRPPSTCVALAVGGRYWGRVLLEDSPREGASAAVAELHRLGVRVALLSGDSAEAAARTAAQLGIEQSLSRCRPDQKIEALATARQGGKTVAMAGDGVNDAPALARADVGIALGAGTDLARQSANVVLLSNRLEQIPWLIALGRRTRRVIRQNLAWALAYNCVALAAAATGHLHPLLAAVAMVVSSLTLLANSLRLAQSN